MSGSENITLTLNIFFKYNYGFCTCRDIMVYIDLSENYDFGLWLAWVNPVKRFWCTKSMPNFVFNLNQNIFF